MIKDIIIFLNKHKDKQCHILWGSYITMILILFGVNWAMTIVICVIVSFMKQVIDKYYLKTGFCYLDIISGMLGNLSTLLLLYLLMIFQRSMI